MPHSRKVSVIIATYNERENIIPLIEAILQAINNQGEVIVVDDNSPDGTSQIVMNWQKQNPKAEVRLITRLRDRGLTKSIREGVEASKYEIIVRLDADFSHPPQVIPLLCAKITEGYDFSNASRYADGGKSVRKLSDEKDSIFELLLSKILNFMNLIFLSSKAKDYTSGFFATRKELIQRIGLRGDYGEYSMDLLFRAILLNYKITEVAYISEPRLYGESKTAANLRQLFNRGINYLRFFISLFWLKIKVKIFKRVI